MNASMAMSDSLLCNRLLRIKISVGATSCSRRDINIIKTDMRHETRTRHYNVKVPCREKEKKKFMILLFCMTDNNILSSEYVVRTTNSKSLKSKSAIGPRPKQVAGYNYLQSASGESLYCLRKT